MAGRPGAVETSPYRKEIEEMIAEGKPDSVIVRWLKEQGTPITRQTISSYRKNSFNIPEEATREYQAKQSIIRKDKAVKKQVSDLDYCDNIIKLADKVKLKVDHNNKITELDIKKLGLQAIKTKQNIFKQGGEDDNEFTIRIIGVDSDEDDNLETEPETESDHQS